MTRCGLLPVLTLLAACAAERSVDEREDRIYRREVARIEADEAFEKKKAACARSRGVVIVNRTGSGRMRARLEDPGLATCMPGVGGSVYYGDPYSQPKVSGATSGAQRGSGRNPIRNGES